MEALFAVLCVCANLTAPVSRLVLPAAKQGDFAGSSMKQPDALTFNKVAKWPDICKSINTGNLDNRLVTQAEYISCRVTVGTIIGSNPFC